MPIYNVLKVSHNKSIIRFHIELSNASALLKKKQHEFVNIQNYLSKNET